MRSFFLGLFMLPSFCFANELKEVPSIYINPKLEKVFWEHPSIISNGYVVVNDLKKANYFFDHIPPDANFDSQDIIIFAWSGSTDDCIDYSAEEATYHFVYKKGMTQELTKHIKLFVMDKNDNWLYHRVLE